MKRFKEFLAEDSSPIVSTQREVKANLDDQNTIDELNRILAQVTGVGFVNPYAGFQKVSKVLSTYGILLPQSPYLPEPVGEEVFEVQQWGMHPGYPHNFNDRNELGIETNPGPVPYQSTRSEAEAADEQLYVYFTYEMNVNGTYDAFAMVVDDEGLETIVSMEDIEYDGEQLDEILTVKPKTPRGQKQSDNYWRKKEQAEKSAMKVFDPKGKIMQTLSKKRK